VRVLLLSLVAITTACGGGLSTDQTYVIEVESPTPQNGSVPLLAAWWSPSYDPNTGQFAARTGLVDVAGITAGLSGDDVFTLSLSRPLLNGFPSVVQFDVGPLGGVYFDEAGVVAAIAAVNTNDGVVVDPPTLNVGQFVVGGNRVSDNEFNVILEYRYDCGDDDTATLSGTVIAGAPDALECISERISLHGSTVAASF
jgi:hypothetical protein